MQVVQVGREMRMPRTEIERLVGQSDERQLVLYGRVSGHGQAGDFATQLERLQTWSEAERADVETVVLSDIGSGLKRRLQALAAASEARL